MKKKQVDEYVKACRKVSREAEIKDHGHPVSHRRVHVSKKTYNRNRMKAGDRSLPCFLYGEMSFVISEPPIL